MTTETFARVLDLNLAAPFALSCLAARAMRGTGGGAIVNVASVMGLRSIGEIPDAAYVASKAGIIGLTRELASQWGRYGIRVNAVAPGFFASEMTAELGDDPESVPEFLLDAAPRCAAAGAAASSTTPSCSSSAPAAASSPATCSASTADGGSLAQSGATGQARAAGRPRTSGATSRCASSKPEPSIAPPAARAAMPWQTTASLKYANAWYHSTSETSKPGPRRVALDDLRARREALGGGHRRHRSAPRRATGVVARLAPVREQRSEVGERVAERAHLPVEHGEDAARRRRVKDRVVEPVVAVHDRRGALRGQRADERVAQLVERGQLAASSRRPTASTSGAAGARRSRPAGRSPRGRPRAGRPYAGRRATSTSAAPIAARGSGASA